MQTDNVTQEQPGQGDNAAIAEDEVMVFKTNCSNCNSPSDTRMKVVGMSLFCDVALTQTV